MEAYVVPQRNVRVRVHLLDGRDLDGVMYASAEGFDGEPGHLIDRLNEDDSEFLPLTDATATHLIHATQILTIRVADEVEEQAELEVKETELSRNLLVKLQLVYGVEVIGHLAYLRPEGNARLLDYLNSASRFFPVIVENRLTYVNRDQIITARALSKE